MATVLEPQLGPNGERLKWVPEKIPSTKPFMHITTSACDKLSPCENMNFIKTKSLIYSPFHSTARYINFDIGYSKESKWLEYLADKWNEFANFFVAGFFEAIYSTDESDDTPTYVQLDAKLIDYDVRFRTSTSNLNSQSPSSPRSPTNAFANRRNQSTLNNSPNRKLPRSDLNKRSDSIIKNDDEEAYEEATEDESSENKTDQRHDEPIMIDDEPPTNTRKTKKRALSDLCHTDDESDQTTNESTNIKPKRSYNKKGGRGGRGGRGGHGKN